MEEEKKEVFECEICGKECKSKSGLTSHMKTHKKEPVDEDIKKDTDLFFSPHENQLISHLFNEVSFKGKDTVIAARMKTLIDSGWPNPGTRELKTIAGILGSTAVPFSQVEVAADIKQKLRNALDINVNKN